MRAILLAGLAAAGALLLVAVAAVLRPAGARAAGADGHPVLAPDAPVVLPARPQPPGTHLQEARKVQLGLPDPERQPVGTPARAAAEWLSAWHQRAWSRLRLWTTPTPADPMTASDLRDRLWVARLDGWALRHVDVHGARARATVDVALHPALGQHERRASFDIGLRRTGGVWQVRADDVAVPVAGAMG
ncbi:MAG TPA: hypothetical protein VFT50_07090 [Baekduia sp.]|nr:hypothetical protein [Baekduia sp.]